MPSPPRVTRFAAAALLIGPLVLLLERPARASGVSLGLEAGPTSYVSNWRSDFGGGATLKAGARLVRFIGVDFQAWESYASVDNRVNTGLSFGATGYLPLARVSPFARVFGLHQHEEGWVSVVNAPAGTSFGIGSGIRHRAGGGLSLGAELPLSAPRDDKRITWLAAGELTGTYFPDSTLGPAAYFGFDLRVGFDYSLK